MKAISIATRGASQGAGLSDDIHLRHLAGAATIGSSAACVPCPGSDAPDPAAYPFFVPVLAFVFEVRREAAFLSGCPPVSS